MKNLPEHVEQSIRRRMLFPQGVNMLVAVSGGLDSIVLLHLLHDIASRFGWRLCVAHFNHQLRGRASDGDERFVAKTSAELGLPVRVGKGSVKAIAKKKGVSIEMAARELRHKFLARTARQMHCPVIAFAHHADDQVELFFLRLLRGSGGGGLGGMKWKSDSSADGSVQIVRPLIDVPKQVLERFARHRQIRYREDASNASGDFLRNRVRHELLPLLRRRFQPALDRTILRVMDIVSADAELADDVARTWLKLKPARRRIGKEPIGLQRRIIQVQLWEQGIEANHDLIDSLRCSLGRPVSVFPDVCVKCDESGRVLRTGTKCTSFRRQRLRIPLAGMSGITQFGGTRVEWKKVVRRGAVLGKPVTRQEIFDAEQVGVDIILRHWRAGDRFQPIGMTVAVKLQDWFTNQKIPREQRRRLIVGTTSRGEIFWVEGERIGERFKLTPHTRRRLVWRWRAAQTT